jgi:hypothetical protein
LLLEVRPDKVIVSLEPRVQVLKHIHLLKGKASAELRLQGEGLEVFRVVCSLIIDVRNDTLKEGLILEVGDALISS